MAKITYVEHMGTKKTGRRKWGQCLTVWKGLRDNNYPRDKPRTAGGACAVPLPCLVDPDCAVEKVPC